MTVGSEIKNSVILSKHSNQRVGIIVLFIGAIQMALSEHHQKQWFEVQKRSTEFKDSTCFYCEGK